MIENICFIHAHTEIAFSNDFAQNGIPVGAIYHTEMCNNNPNLASINKIKKILN